jgi:hypothetical protein
MENIAHGLSGLSFMWAQCRKHISKASAKRVVMITETPAIIYTAVTLPHIQGVPKTAIQWVYNILDKSKDAGRLLFEDPDDEKGFILQPDMKWDQLQVYMHVQALGGTAVHTVTTSTESSKCVQKY